MAQGCEKAQGWPFLRTGVPPRVGQRLYMNVGYAKAGCAATMLAAGRRQRGAPAFGGSLLACSKRGCRLGRTAAGDLPGWLARTQPALERPLARLVCR